MGEVDELDDAVDHRVAQGDQRVQRTVRQPDGQHLGERRRILDECVDQSRDAECEHAEPEHVGLGEFAPVHQQGRRS